MDKSRSYVDDSANHNNGVDIGAGKQTDADNKLAATAAELRHEKRTPGLKLFDVFLYPIVTNFSVFAISVAATYLTARGGDRNAAGKLVYGRIGAFFHKRGEWLVGKFRGMGMNPGQADMSKMVFFSFLDGSLVAPLVKLIEDKREKIGFFIDNKLGTKPENLSVYDEEPKQSWRSVLGGRLATVAIVVPTAVALDKTGLNNVLFNAPGKRTGEWVAKQPGIAKWFGKLDIKELFRIGFFESFYTSVCTAGLYFSSRGLALLMGDKWKLDDATEKKIVEDRNIRKTAGDNDSTQPEEQPAAKHSDKIKRHQHKEAAPGSFSERYAQGATGQPSFLGV